MDLDCRTRGHAPVPQNRWRYELQPGQLPKTLKQGSTDADQLSVHPSAEASWGPEPHLALAAHFTLGVQCKTHTSTLNN